MSKMVVEVNITRIKNENTKIGKLISSLSILAVLFQASKRFVKTKNKDITMWTRLYVQTFVSEEAFQQSYRASGKPGCEPDAEEWLAEKGWSK